MVRHHQNAWTTEVCYTYLIRLVWSRPVVRSHSWQTNAVEPLPIWCSLLFLERLGGLFSYLEGASLCSEQRHNQGHLWLERHCPSGPCVQTNPGNDRQMPILKIDKFDGHQIQLSKLVRSVLLSSQIWCSSDSQCHTVLSNIQLSSQLASYQLDKTTGSPWVWVSTLVAKWKSTAFYTFHADHVVIV